MDERRLREAQNAYSTVRPIQRIVDAYAALIPWGGLTLLAGPGDQRPVDLAAADVVRGLLVSGSSTSEVRVGDRSAAVAFSYDSYGGPSLVGAVASVGAAYQRAIGVQRVPAEYLELLIGQIGGGAACPLWLLDQGQVAKCEVGFLMTTLFQFVARCDVYRQAIAYDVGEAFGARGNVTWRRELWAEDADVPPLRYAPTHSAFCETLGVDLAPLRDYARKYASTLGMILRPSEISELDRAFAPCSAVTSRLRH